METIHKVKQKLSQFSFDKHCHERDFEEYILKGMVHKLLDDFSVDELKAIFSFSKIDPRSNKAMDILYNPTTSENIKNKIIQLKEDELVEYEISIKSKNLLDENKSPD